MPRLIQRRRVSHREVAQAAHHARLRHGIDFDYSRPGVPLRQRCPWCPALVYAPDPPGFTDDNAAPAYDRAVEAALDAAVDDHVHHQCPHPGGTP